MEGLIVYGSAYGATQRYAQELARRLGWPCLGYRQVTAEQLREAGCLIYGGGLYAGGVLGLKQTLRRLPDWRGKRLAVFTVGLADPSLEENRRHIAQGLHRQLPPDLCREEDWFFLRGGMDYARLGVAHRAMMAALAAKVRRLPLERRSAEDQTLLDTYGGKLDFVDLSTLEPLERWAKRLG